MRQRWLIAVVVCALLAPVGVVVVAWVFANIAGVEASGRLPTWAHRSGSFGGISVVRADPSVGVRVSVMYGNGYGDRPPALYKWSFWPGLPMENTVSAAAGWPWPALRWGQLTMLSYPTYGARGPQAFKDADELTLTPDLVASTPVTSVPANTGRDLFANTSPRYSVDWISKPISITVPGFNIGLPWSPYWPGFIANCVVYFAVLMTLASVVMTVLSRRRIRLQCCVRCTYDLRGLTSARCPECGTPKPALRTPLSAG